MFFRREKARTLSFSDRMNKLKEVGFALDSDPSGGVRAAKHGCAAVLSDRAGDLPGVDKAGVLIGNEIGLLVNGGYQQFFVTPSGKKVAALAQQLRALHDFQEDLKEGLGSISLYNQSLGTTSDRHMYDRVVGRDRGGRPPAIATREGH
jgi:hypothetical protein